MNLHPLRPFTIFRGDKKKYLTRYYFTGKWFRKLFNRNPFLHHFHSSDDVEFHNHRWRFGYSLILRGGYVETRKKKVNDDWVTTIKKYAPFSFNRLDNDCFHRVDLLDEERGCWSLFWAGPFAAEDWGFLRDDGTIEYARSRFKGRRDDLSDD